jgi:hypothetical protein
MKMQLAHSNSVTPVAAAALVCGMMLAANVDTKTFVWEAKPAVFGPASLKEIAEIDGQQAEAPSWRRIVARRFADVGALTRGWDGPASIAVSLTALGLAERLLEVAFQAVSFPAVPSVVPSGDGSVQLEWRLADSRFEVEVDPSGDVSAWALDRKSGLSIERAGNAAIEMLFNWSSRLTADKYTVA